MEQTPVISLRMPLDLIERVDKMTTIKAKDLSEASGMEIQPSRAATMRWLLTKALEEEGL